MSILLEMVRRRRAELAAARAGDDDEEAFRLEGSLIDFVEAAWPSIDPAPYQQNWAVDGLCEHLQAVAEGDIKRLLVNFPPRCSKTLVTSVAFPAWIWAQRERAYLKGPQTKFLCGSYGHTLSVLNANLCRRLVISRWYQSLWGRRFTLRGDQLAKAHFDTSEGGSRISVSTGSGLLGIGGDLILIDDPHSTTDVESEAERESVLRWFSEISTTRLNNPKEAAIVVIMQRLSEYDVSGKILSDSTEDWAHLMIPMEFEAARCGRTVLGWTDPRGLDEVGEPLLTFPEREPINAEAAAILEEREGSLMWPDRFGPRELQTLKAGLGPYMASGRLQQSPAPKSGGILRREWFMFWDGRGAGGRVHADYRIASLDGAFTDDEENDPSALVVLGTFTHPELNERRIMLMHAWQRHLSLHGDSPPLREPWETPIPGETEESVRRKNSAYQQRIRPGLGLVESVRETCQRFKVDLLLIENKASGIHVAQELQRIYSWEGLATVLVTPKGDKVARAHAVVPMLAQQLLYVPNFDWGQMVIDQAAMFPRGRHDDLVDSLTQGLIHLRNRGLARTPMEVSAEKLLASTPRPRLKSLYGI